MKKDTSELLKELKNFSDFGDFYTKNSSSLAKTEPGEYIENIIDEKGLSKAEVVSRSEMSEVYAYQIMSGIKKRPKREKLLCLAFGMGLSLDETQKMLKSTGYAPLYAKIPFDAVVIYGLCKGMSIVEVNNLLFEYGQETLG